MGISDTTRGNYSSSLPFTSTGIPASHTGAIPSPNSILSNVTKLNPPDKVKKQQYNLN